MSYKKIFQIIAKELIPPMHPAYEVPIHKLVICQNDYDLEFVESITMITPLNKFILGDQVIVTVESVDNGGQK